MIEAIGAWWPIALLALVGGAWGGVQAVAALDGRLDWFITYRAIDSDGKEIGPSGSFELHGHLYYRNFAHGAEIAWHPDPGSAVPTLETGKYYIDAKGHFHRTRGGEAVE